MGWRNFNDRLAIIILGLIVSLWIATCWLCLPESVIGATIVAFTLVIQFYFRKKSGGD